MLTAVLTLSACSGSGDDDDSGSGGAADAAAVPAPADDAPQRDAFVADSVVAADEPTSPADVERAIISKGNIQLSSDDVEKAVFDVVALVDKYGGEITDRETGTDDDGEVRLARLVLRIPAASYPKAFDQLQQVADLESSSSTSEDVTTQIIDLDARIRAQRASLERVEVLLDRAQSIRDIVAIESQLTRRQADLDSLVKRQAYLRDQTSLSTLTVNIERAADEAKDKKKDDDDLGFVSGLENGGKWLLGFVLVVLTIAGVVLPWAIAALVVGWPLWVLARRLNLRGRIPARTRSDA
jgi:hypothetical protein